MNEIICFNFDIVNTLLNIFAIAVTLWNEQTENQTLCICKSDIWIYTCYIPLFCTIKIIWYSLWLMTQTDMHTRSYYHCMSSVAYCSPTTLPYKLFFSPLYCNYWQNIPFFYMLVILRAEIGFFMNILLCMRTFVTDSIPLKYRFLLK